MNISISGESHRYSHLRASRLFPWPLGPANKTLQLMCLTSAHECFMLTAKQDNDGRH